MASFQVVPVEKLEKLFKSKSLVYAYNDYSYSFKLSTFESASIYYICSQIVQNT